MKAINNCDLTKEKEKGDNLVTFYFYLENNRVKIAYTACSDVFCTACFKASIIKAFDPR